MEIIHPSGEAYDLASGSKLEITRANPFFNDIGEQSLPISLPLTPKNSRLLQFPNRLDRTEHPVKELDVIVRHGVFNQHCRQVIFGVDATTIDTTFYLNTGDFYTRMKEISINDIFGDTVWNYDDVGIVLDKMWQWYIHGNDTFAVFPVIANDPNKQDGYKMLNRIDFDAAPFYQSYFPFYNRITRTETVDEVEIAIPRGYYMTPFLKCNWVLNAIFEYLGYKLNDNFFTRTPEFQRLVFLNNTADAIVTGVIHAVDLLPSGNISDLLDVFRKRFRCEFIPNQDKTVDIVLFEEVIVKEVKTDLSEKLGSKPFVTFTEPAKCLITQMQTYEWPKSITKLSEVIREIKTISDRNYPTVGFLYNHITTSGGIYRGGMAGMDVVNTLAAQLDEVENDLDTTIKDKEEIFLADKICTPILSSAGTGTWEWPFIGDYRCVRSIVAIQDEESPQEMVSADLDYMLCFFQGDADNLVIGNQIYPATFRYGDMEATTVIDEPIWNRLEPSYTLYIDGQHGIYNKFHSAYGAMAHNAFNSIECDLYLSDLEKSTLSATDKIVLNNQVYLPDYVEYSLGEFKSSKCTLRDLRVTIKKDNYLPLRISHIPVCEYYWEVKVDYGTKPMLMGWGYKVLPPTEFFDAPTAQEYEAGGKYHQKTFECWHNIENSVNKQSFTLTVWLEPRKG